MLTVEDFIAEQVAIYDARRRVQIADHRTGRGKFGVITYGPYLLISRTRGSGGHTVAQLVGQRLGWAVWDNEIVDKVAQRTQVRRQLIESLDEHARSMVEDILAPVFNRQDIGQANYTRHLKQVLLSLGHQGDAIIVGRGAQFLLPSQFGLRVRLVADLDIRVQRLTAARGIPPAQAQREIKKSDEERAAFIRCNYQQDINDPVNQDIVINTSALGSHQVTEIILTALHEKLGIETGNLGQTVAYSGEAT